MNNSSYRACLLVLILFIVTSLYAGTWHLLGPGDADQVTSLSIDYAGLIYAGTDIGGIYISSDMGESWSVLNNGLQNHDITTPVIHDADKKTHYVGTRGGLYKTYNHGDTWINVRNGLPKVREYSLSGSIGSIAIDLNDQKRLYVGLGYRPSTPGNKTVKKLAWSDSIFISDDSGESWSKLKIFHKPQKVNQITPSIQEKNIIYVATSKGLYKGDLDKNKWIQIYNKEILNILLFEDYPGRIIASAGEIGVLRTDDYGETWKEINNGLGFHWHRSGKNRYSVLASSKKTGAIFVTNSTWGSSGGLYSSDNYGTNWRLLTSNMPESWLDTSRRMNAVAVDRETDEIFLASSRYIYKSDNNGETWEQLISKPVDNGWQHTGINVFGHTRQIVVTNEKPEIMFIATADHGMVKSVNGGKSWNPVKSLGKNADNVWDIALCGVKPEKVYVIGSSISGDLCSSYSLNYGENWKTLCKGLGKTNRNEKIYIKQNDRACNTLYIAGNDGIRVSYDSGNSWDGKPLLSGKVINALLLDKSNTNKLFAGTNDGLFISNDEGKTWIKANINATQITSIFQSVKSKNVLLVGTGLNKKNSSSVYKSEDYGESWRPVFTGIRKYVSAFAESYQDDNIVFASTNDYNYHDLSQGYGILMSNDLGETWVIFGDDLPTKKVFNITTTPKYSDRVYVSLQGGGVYYANIKDLVKAHILHQ